MLLAITATDVAFVSVIVGGLTTIAGPLITWQIAKGGRKHERDVELRRRNYDARRDVYVDMLRWSRLVYDRLVEYADGEEPREGPGEEETLSMVARIAAFGSKTVNAKLHEFDDAWSNAWDEIAAAEGAGDEDAARAVNVDEAERLHRDLLLLVQNELTH